MLKFALISSGTALLFATGVFVWTIIYWQNVYDQQTYVAKQHQFDYEHIRRLD